MYSLSAISILGLTLHILITCALPNSAPLIPRHRHHAWIGEFNVNHCTDKAIGATDSTGKPLWPQGLGFDARPHIYNSHCIPWYPAFTQKASTSVGIWWGHGDMAISQVKIYSGTDECEAGSKNNVPDSCCSDTQLLGVINKNGSGTDEFGANEGCSFDGACVDDPSVNLVGMKYFKGFT